MAYTPVLIQTDLDNKTYDEILKSVTNVDSTPKGESFKETLKNYGNQNDVIVKAYENGGSANYTDGTYAPANNVFTTYGNFLEIWDTGTNEYVRIDPPAEIAGVKLVEISYDHYNPVVSGTNGSATCRLLVDQPAHVVRNVTITGPDGKTAVNNGSISNGDIVTIGLIADDGYVFQTGKYLKVYKTLVSGLAS